LKALRNQLDKFWIGVISGTTPQRELIRVDGITSSGIPERHSVRAIDFPHGGLHDLNPLLCAGTIDEVERKSGLRNNFELQPMLAASSMQRVAIGRQPYPPSLICPALAVGGSPVLPPAKYLIELIRIQILSPSKPVGPKRGDQLA
jgi:hypothetical protein